VRHPTKVLVTGGAGYIGAHTVVELTQQGYFPIVVDDFSRSDKTLISGIEKITGKKVNLYEGNCSDQNFLSAVFAAEPGIDAVMHFAAYKSVGESVRKPLDYYENNLRSLVSLLSIMEREKTNYFIFSSSCTVYGQPDEVPVDESTPFKKAESPYGATKQMCERILEDAVHASNELKAITLRYFNPVGAHPTAWIGEMPLDVPGNLVPFMTQTAAGIRKKMVIFGNDYSTPDGTCIRDYIHVVDLAKAHVSALNRMQTAGDLKPFEPYNLGSGRGVSVMELIKTFVSVTGVPLPFEVGPRRAGDIEQTYANPAKAWHGLGWKTEYTIEDALLHAWNWQKKIGNIKLELPLS
jgi:UDP-glucose 4-epimerase